MKEVKFIIRSYRHNGQIHIHKYSSFQSLQNPIAVMSIEGKQVNRLAIFSLKLLFGETDVRKYLIIHNR